jgi:transposase
MRGKAHSDETRAAVMAALLAGQGVNDVAEQFKIPKQTVSLINQSLDKFGLKKAESKIPQLVETALEALLESVILIANKTKDDKWLSEQPADKLAVFQGVNCDKAFRILDAASRAGITEETTG